MFTKTGGGKVYGYATLLAVCTMLSACGPGTDNPDAGDGGGTDGSVDGGQHTNLTVLDPQATNVTDTEVDVQGTLFGGPAPTSEGKLPKIEVICANNVGWSSTKQLALADTGSLTRAWTIHFDGLLDETDYTASATAIDTDGARSVTKKITFRTHKPVVEDPLYVELVRQMLPGKIVMVPPAGHENDPNWLYTGELSFGQRDLCPSKRTMDGFDNRHGSPSYCLDPDTLTVPADDAYAGSIVPCDNALANAWSASVQQAVARFNTDHGACRIGVTHRIEINSFGLIWLYERYAP